MMSFNLAACAEDLLLHLRGHTQRLELEIELELEFVDSCLGSGLRQARNSAESPIKPESNLVLMLVF